jgi:hypothetical protein
MISKNTGYTLLPQWKLHISHKILSSREDTLRTLGAEGRIMS